MVLLKLSVLCLLSLVHCSDILFLLPMAGKSHKNVFDPLITELANRKHNITVISPFKSPVPLSNIRDIIMTHEQNKDSKIIADVFNFVEQNPIIFFSLLKPFIMTPCLSYLQNPEVKFLIDSGKKFDVVVISGFMNECALTTAHLLGDTLIQLDTGPVYSWLFSEVPQPLSFVPNSLLSLTDQMSFSERLYNCVFTLALRLLYRYKLLEDIESTVREYFPQALTIIEAENRIQFILTNSDLIMDSPRPSLSNVVHVGGMHCKEAHPLPKDLQDFVVSSGEDGFILFSLGSNAQAKFLAPEKKDAFINAFARLKQKVIWKYEDESGFEKKHKNLLVRQWLPQQDLLGDSHIRLFMTHGGLLSSQEALYHGVPLLGIPLFSDQRGNIARAKQLHIGSGIDFGNITEKTIYDSIMQIINDKSYAENMKKYSSIYRNQPEKPVKRAAFWVEFVIKHKKIIDKTIVPKKLHFIQYFSLDVLSFIFVIVFIVCFVTFNIFKYIVLKYYK